MNQHFKEHCIFASNGKLKPIFSHRCLFICRFEHYRTHWLLHFPWICVYFIQKSFSSDLYFHSFSQRYLLASFGHIYSINWKVSFSLKDLCYLSSGCSMKPFSTSIKYFILRPYTMLSTTLHQKRFDRSGLCFPGTNLPPDSKPKFGGRESVKRQWTSCEASIATFMNSQDSTEIRSTRWSFQTEVRPACLSQNIPSVPFICIQLSPTRMELPNALSLHQETRWNERNGLKFLLSDYDVCIQTKIQQVLKIETKTTAFRYSARVWARFSFQKQNLHHA